MVKAILCFRGEVADRPHTHKHICPHTLTQYILFFGLTVSQKTHTHESAELCMHTVPGTGSAQHSKSLTKH